MKGLIFIFVSLLILFGITFSEAQQFKMTSRSISLFTSGEVQYDEWIGIYAEDYLTLFLFMKTPLTGQTFPLTITLKADDTKDEKVMVIKELLDLPRKSVQTECPRSEKYKYNKCWFIKYRSDE